MINMDYCRFNNIKMALDECLDAIQNGKTLSEPEMEACKIMFRQFIDFCCNSGIIEDEDGELDDRLEEFFETIGDKAYWN